MALLCQINVPTQVRIPFRMVDATDGTTPEPGLTPSAFLCGPTGDTYAAAAGGVVEISNGDYVYTPVTADVSANGIVITRFTGTGAMEARGVPVQVVGFDPTQTIPTAAAVAAIPTNPVTGTIARDAGGSVIISGGGLLALETSVQTAITDIAALPTATENAAELLGSAIEGSFTLQDSFKINNAVLNGLLSGAPLGGVFRDLSNTLNRVTTVTDADGNRTSITFNLS